MEGSLGSPINTEKPYAIGELEHVGHLWNNEAIAHHEKPCNEAIIALPTNSIAAAEVY